MKLNIYNYDQFPTNINEKRFKKVNKKRLNKQERNKIKIRQLRKIKLSYAA